MQQPQITIDPNDVINALNARLSQEAQRNIMLEAAVAKLQRDLADASKPKVDPAE